MNRLNPKMKLFFAVLLIGSVLAGCGSEGEPRPKAPVDAEGVETRANGTKIERQDNGDK